MRIHYFLLFKNWLCLSLSFAFLVFFSLSLQAQTGPGKLWDKTYGGIDFDNLKSLQQTSDGGYILGGASSSGISGTKSEASKGYYDWWVIKLDASGNKIWDKTLGGVEGDYLSSLQQTNDGAYILAGSSGSNITGDKTQANIGSLDYWVIKLDVNGNKIWDKTFGGIGGENCYFVQQTSDGGFILGGHSNSEIGADKSQPCRGNWDYWVVKLDANGNKIWDKTFGGSNRDELYSLQQTIDGGYILGGISFSGISGDKSQSSKGNEDYWIVKLDAGGNKLWDKTFGGSDQDWLASLKQTSDGGYILGGHSKSGISVDKSQASKGARDYWIIKLDAAGNKLWDKTIGGSSNDYISSLQLTSDGGYILGGNSDSGISGDKSQISQGGDDYWVVKLDASGNKLWDKAFGGSNNDWLTSLQQTSNGGFILGGDSGSGIGGDKSQPHWGQWDYWVVELAAPCTALTATLSVNCKSGNSNVNLSVIGIQPGANGTPFWTLTYKVNGVRQTATGTTSTIVLEQNATPGAVYTLESIVSGTCTAILTNSLIVPQLPDAPTVILGNNCGTGSVTLSATGAPSGGDYVWYDVASGGTPLYSNPSGTFITPNLSSSTTYYVAASNNAGCEGTRTAVSAITPCPSVIIPNIVTPNSDKKNDFFSPQYLPAGKWQLQIYNRWGIKVFRSVDYQSSWPDTKVSDGTYFYYLKNSETGQQYKGWVEVAN